MTAQSQSILPASSVAPPSARALTPEWAARLGHLCTADDPLVREMLDGFQSPGAGDSDRAIAGVSFIDTSRTAPLPHVIAVGGSYASVPNVLAPQKILGYVKVASAAVNVTEVAALSAPVVNPEAIGKLITGAADTQATVLPVGNVRIPGRSLLQSVGHALLATFEHAQGGALYDTLEYVVACGWDEGAGPWQPGSKHRPRFACPFCDAQVLFPRRRRQFRCHGCSADLTLVDALGLVTDASESSSDSAVAMNLKAVLEHLTLLTCLRRLVESGPGFHDAVLLLRDGPLMLRGGAARLLADPVRAWLRFLDDHGTRYALAGIEREGAFASHRQQAGEWFHDENAVFVPDNRYTLERIKHSGGATAVYGRRGLYGSKAFCRIDAQTVFVLSVPNRRHNFDAFAADPTVDDLVGLDRALATLKSLVSRHFPGVPLPLVAVERLLSFPRHATTDLVEWVVQRTSPGHSPCPRHEDEG
jgi:hypothetical protein